MKTAIILMAFVALVGCAPTVIYKPVPVETPVSVPCKIPVVPAPDFPTKALTAQSTMFEEVRALLAENELHQGYEAMLTASLKACQ